jgi:hypothetical protein
MGTLLLILISASMFSIDGLGEDLSVFRVPFIEDDRLTQIKFSFYPEFNILYEDGNYRGIFWTNPLNFSISIPMIKGFTFMAGNRERFNQSFDIFYEDSIIQVNQYGEGGIEEVYVVLSKNFGIGELVLSGSYLFGNASEIWTYDMANHTLTDTFTYTYRGNIFGCGIRHRLFSIAYEGLGTVDATQADAESDTTFDLPKRLSIAVTPKIGSWQTEFMFEHSFWTEYWRSPNRFKVGLARDNYKVAYRFNPWYIEGINEHGLDLSVSVPLGGVGSASIGLYTTYRYRDELHELQIIPSLHLVLNEIFTRRRK